MPLLDNPGLLTGNGMMPGNPVNTAPHCKRHTCLFAAENVNADIGGLPFGHGVTSDPTPGMTEGYDRFSVKLPVTADTGKFVGIVAYNEGVEGVLNGDFEDYEHPRGYLPNKVLPVYYSGCIAVPVTAAVSPASPVFLVVAAGLTRGQFTSVATGNIAVPNASWRGSGEAGELVALYIDLLV